MHNNIFHAIKATVDKAYHLIQAFEPGEVSPPEAHRIGQELARQRDELTSTYKTCEKEVRELSRKLDNLNQYLGRDSAPQNEPTRDKTKSL